MPTNRRKRVRAIMRREIMEAEWKVLNDIPLSDGERIEWTYFYDDDDGGMNEASRLRKLWLEHRDVILSRWIAEKPGTRPTAWWRYDAPRIPLGTYPGWYFDGKLALPRQRIGGIGTPAHEALAYAPSFETGIPVHWVNTFDVELYNGRAKDIHGNPIMAAHFKEGDFKFDAVDPANPPIFESEANYLDRHNLLLPGERQRLKPVDFEPEVLRVERVPEGENPYE